MTDIYRQELAIPEKRKVFGWLMLAGGGLMLLIAVFLFYMEASQVRKYEMKPGQQVDQGQVDQAQQKAMLERSKPLVWGVLVSVGLLMIFIVGATLNHRMAARLRDTSGRKRVRTVLGDPWKEAGERLQIDEIEEEKQE